MAKENIIQEIGLRNMEETDQNEFIRKKYKNVYTSYYL